MLLGLGTSRRSFENSFVVFILDLRFCGWRVYGKLYTRTSNASSDATQEPTTPRSYKGHKSHPARNNIYCLHRKFSTGIVMEKHFTCPRCNQKLSSLDKNEHDDWHYAMDLEDEDNNSSQRPPNPARLDTKQNNPLSASTKLLQPVAGNQTTGSKNDNATRTHRHVAYANAVDKAANLRAQSEASFVSRIFTRFRLSS